MQFDTGTMQDYGYVRPNNFQNRGYMPVYDMEVPCRFDLASILAGAPNYIFVTKQGMADPTMQLMVAFYGFPGSRKNSVPCIRNYMIDLKNHIGNLALRYEAAMSAARIQVPPVVVPEYDITPYDTTSFRTGLTFGSIATLASDFQAIKRNLFSPVRGMEATMARVMGKTAPNRAEFDDSCVMNTVTAAKTGYLDVGTLCEFYFCCISLIDNVAGAVRAVHMDLDKFQKTGGTQRLSTGLRRPKPAMVQDDDFSYAQNDVSIDSAIFRITQVTGFTCVDEFADLARTFPSLAVAARKARHTLSINEEEYPQSLYSLQQLAMSMLATDALAEETAPVAITVAQVLPHGTSEITSDHEGEETRTPFEEPIEDVKLDIASLKVESDGSGEASGRAGGEAPLIGGVDLYGKREEVKAGGDAPLIGGVNLYGEREKKAIQLVGSTGDLDDEAADDSIIVLDLEDLDDKDAEYCFGHVDGGVPLPEHVKEALQELTGYPVGTYRKWVHLFELCRLAQLDALGAIPNLGNYVYPPVKPFMDYLSGVGSEEFVFEPHKPLVSVPDELRAQVRELAGAPVLNQRFWFFPNEFEAVLNAGKEALFDRMLAFVYPLCRKQVVALRGSIGQGYAKVGVRRSNVPKYLIRYASYVLRKHIGFKRLWFHLDELKLIARAGEWELLLALKDWVYPADRACYNALCAGKKSSRNVHDLLLSVSPSGLVPDDLVASCSVAGVFLPHGRCWVFPDEARKIKSTDPVLYKQLEAWVLN